ncbi:WbqC family protein [Ulvibacterium sp.]|uniref:WbqC family protein n=1 Tax=Ulvibacterium sp. TaxID=2665914 RepID=UPI002639DA31|nr:WbqC family protein [Ulvibacterium sp.]
MYTLLHPTYFPNIAIFSVITRDRVLWEIEDNYQKQTYRNRCYISTDQGKHMLTIPIKHVGGKEGRQKYKEVRLDNSYSWQRQHWRTLQTAYRTSPFFEYYEDDIAPLFREKHFSLLDFNLRTIETVCNCLQIEMPLEKTVTYHKNVKTQNPIPKILDARHLVNAKKEIRFVQETYTQVFGSRNGFIENLSVLDLLFNEGPHTVSFLKNQNLDFIYA